MYNNQVVNGLRRVDLTQFDFFKDNLNYEDGYQWNEGADTEYWQYPPIKSDDMQLNEQYEAIAKWVYRYAKHAAEMEPQWKKEREQHIEREKIESENKMKIKRNRHIAKGGKFFEDFKPVDEKQADALRAVMNFNESKSRFMLIMGNTGTGKTHLVSSFSFEHNYYMIMSTQLYPSIMEMKYPDINQGNKLLPDRTFDELIKMNLIIDDLGSETVDNKGHLQDGIKTLIDMGNKKVIITTNLNLKALKDKFGDKIMSRILDDCDLVTMIGCPDYRIKTKYDYDNLSQMIIDYDGSENKE